MPSVHPTARALALARSLVEALERLRDEPSAGAGGEVLALCETLSDAAHAAAIEAITEHSPTLQQAAEALGISYRHLCRMRERGAPVPSPGFARKREKPDNRPGSQRLRSTKTRMS